MKKFTPSKTIKVWVIWLWEQSHDFLIPVLLQMSHVKVEVLCTRTESKLYDFAEDFKPTYVTTDRKELLRDWIVDALVVSSNPQLHYDVLKEAIKMGIHCFVEKPPVMQKAQLDELVELSKNSLSITWVWYNFIFASTILKSLKILWSKTAIVTWSMKFFVSSMNTPLDWFETVLETVLYKTLIHPLSLACSIFGQHQQVILQEHIFENNTFHHILLIRFENNRSVIIEYWNFSSKFIYEVSLTNAFWAITTIDNLKSVKVFQPQWWDCVIDKKEVYELTNSPRMSGYANAGYAGELKNRIQSIEENRSSDTDIKNSIEMYEIIEKIKNLSIIPF